MKKIATLLAVVALVALTAGSAMAHCGSCGPKASKAHKEKACSPRNASTCSTDKAMSECCVAAYEAKVCSAKAARASMHDCCVKALDAGKGCCGKDAAAVKAAYEAKAAEAGSGS